MSRSEVFPIVVMMGVSGAGKSTCGEAVAKALRCRFSDADAFHPKENVAKMSSGMFARWECVETSQTRSRVLIETLCHKVYR